MSAFLAINVIPSHGSRTAVIEWTLPADMLDGTVDVAFSLTAAPGSWQLCNDDPLDAAAGYYIDTNFVIQSGVPIGYYRLLWSRGNEQQRSEPVGILGKMTRREYGIINAITLREFALMRATDGFPVFHLIPRDFGTLAANVDPDTKLPRGLECSAGDDAGFAQTYKGGFFPPLLTWVRPLSYSRGDQADRQDSLGSTEDVSMKLSMLAFPQPQIGHILVEPETDRRFMLDKTSASSLRANFPTVFVVDVYFLPTNHPAYKIEVPRESQEWRLLKPHFMS